MAGVSAEVVTGEQPLTMRERMERAERCIAILENRIFDLSQALAEEKHGREAVKTALEAAQACEGLMETFATAPHPFGELMVWFNNPDPVQ